MIPKDKFGREIYPRTFTEMEANGFILMECGYSESSSKSNLFWRKGVGVVFFADMRGTRGVAMWENSSPWMYWTVSADVPRWKARRVVCEEYRLLWDLGCRCTFGFMETFEGEGLFHECRWLDETEGIINWPDGFCVECGADFSSDGDFCSLEYELRDKDRHSEHCAACGEIVEYDEHVDHHASYFFLRKL